MWVFLLLLFSVNFFEIIPITRVLGVNGSFTFYLLSLFFMFTFNRRAWIGDTLHWLVPFWWFMGGVALSFIPAQVYYGQSFLQSFFTYRRFFEFTAYPILIALRPNEKELRSALYGFSILYLVSCVFITFFAPGLVPQVDNREFVEADNYVHVLPGVRHVFLAFIFAFHKAMRKGEINNYAWVFFLFFVLFIAQNRTSLIGAAVVAMYALYSMKTSSRKLLMIAMLVIGVLLLVVYTAGQWYSLYSETVHQITNPEYNRTKSLIYMTQSRSFLRYLLGEGFISGNVNPIVHILQESGIDNTDVGFIGFWHQFGVIPLGTVIVMTVKGLSSRKSFLVRASALYTLTGSLTLSCFSFSETLLWLSIYLYLYYVSDSPKFQEPLGNQDRARYWYYRSISRV